MLTVVLSYVITTAFVPKIRSYFSSNLSILNANVSDISMAILFGSVGSFIGKAICGYFIHRYHYSQILFTSFLICSFLLLLEFTNLLHLTIYMYYIICFLQGFLMGLIFSTIYANLGEFYSDKIYNTYVSLISGALGLAGPVFSIIYVVFSFKQIIYVLFIISIIGAISSFFFIQNGKNKTILSTDRLSKHKISYYKLITQEKSIFAFSLSIALSLIGSLLISTNINRLLTLHLQSIDLSYKYIKIISIIPLFFGSMFFFLPKNERFYYSTITIFIIMSLFYCILGNLIFCLGILVIIYGLHLLLIPLSSSLILSKQIQDHKPYYSYIIHTIRSLYSIILLSLYNNYYSVYVMSFKSLLILLIPINILSFVTYIYGKSLLEKPR